MSDLMKDPLILRQIIMDHYEYPRNHHLTEDEHYHKVHMASESCIDDITVMAKIEDNIVRDVCFDGVACTISTASTDIMCDLLKGKNIEEAKYIIDQFHHMIHEEPFDDSILEEALVFINTSKQAARVRCATIGWSAAEQILKEKK